MTNTAFGALLFVALVGAGLYTYEVFDAQTHSMSPTMNEGDYFLISKRAYDFETPQLGDVILFKIPDWDLWSVARVVGLPGHRVQMIGSSLTIDGQHIGRAGRDPEYTETLPNGSNTTFVRRSEGGMTLGHRSISSQKATISCSETTAITASTAATWSMSVSSPRKTL
jgi:signal peptidase I